MHVQFYKIFFHAVPILRDLYKYFTPEYAPSWIEIGILLGLPDSKIRIIKANNPSDVKRCCNEMLAEWLRMDLDASWVKLFVAVDSPAVSNDQAVNNQGMLALVQ